MLGLIKWDTRSLDYGSHESKGLVTKIPAKGPRSLQPSGSGFGV